MSELQTAVEAMMNLILFGGAEAAKELFKARVVAGAEEASRAWHGVFGEAPDAYPLPRGSTTGSCPTGQGRASPWYHP